MKSYPHQQQSRTESSTAIGDRLGKLLNYQFHNHQNILAHPFKALL